MPKADQITLAIDQGTFSSRACLFDARGNAITTAQQAIELNRLDQHHIEQDAAELLCSVQQVIHKVLDETGCNRQNITAAGLTTQRSSIVAWRPSSGKAISPILSWQDTRAGSWLERFRDQADRVRQTTGLRLSAHYGVSKMRWLIDNNTAVKKALQDGDCVITPLASFILFNISDSSEINIDIANATRTLLCNLVEGDWDEHLLALFSISRAVLPAIRPVRFNYGKLRNTGINLSAVNGDQTAALYSNGMPGVNTLKVNLGTGAFVLCPVTSAQLKSTTARHSGLLSGTSANDSTTLHHYLEGTVNGAGAAIAWLKERYSANRYNDISLPYTAADCLFINSVGGFGSPLWHHDIAPVFIDNNGNMTEVEFERGLSAVLESIVFLLQINIDAMRKVIPDLRKIDITGGLSQKAAINQILADLSGLPVARFVDSEATARGIAWLAAADTSQWQASPKLETYRPQSNPELHRRFHRFKALLNSRYGLAVDQAASVHR